MISRPTRHLPTDTAPRLVRAEGLKSAPLDDEIVILNLARNSYVALDEVGRRVWELLETPRTLEELCGLLGKEFSGEAAEIERDVREFLGRLESEGMVLIAPGDR